MQGVGVAYLGWWDLAVPQIPKTVTNPRPFFIGVAKNPANEKDTTKENS